MAQLFFSYVTKGKGKSYEIDASCLICYPENMLTSPLVSILLVSSIILAACSDEIPFTPSPKKTVEEYRFEREQVRSENKTLVTSCTENALSSHVIEVDYNSSSPCRPGVVRSSSVKYQLFSRSGGISIETKIALAVPSRLTPESRATEMIDQTKACVPLIREVFSRYKIDFKLILEKASDITNADHQIILSDEPGISYSDEWHFKEPFKGDDSEICGTAIHEISHLLGLDDEYKDKNCPDRKYISDAINPISIMKSGHAGWEGIDHYPRHIKTIVQPLCPVYAAEKGWEVPVGLQYRAL